MQRTPSQRRTTHRVLGLVFLVAAALFAARWMSARERGTIAVEPPAPADAMPTDESVAPLVARDDRRNALPDPAPIDGASPVPAAAVTGTSSVPGARLYGSVQLPAGTLPETIGVTCADGHGILRHTRTDERSRYAFDELEPGRYWLRAPTDTGIARATVDVVGDTRVDLELEVLRTLRVRVVDADGVDWIPRGVEVVVTRSAPGDWMPGPRAQRRVPARPLWGVGEPAAATEFAPVVLEWPPPTFVSLVVYERVVATLAAGPSDTELVFRVDRDDKRIQPGRVRFRLVDFATREPVEPTTFQLDGAGTAMPPPPGGVGEVDLQPGLWTLRAFAKPTSYARLQFRVEPGVELDLGDIELGGGATVRGIVVDEEGRGVAASVRCEPCDEHGVLERNSTTIYAVLTAADGTFDLRGLSRGYQRLSPAQAPTESVPRADAMDRATVVRVVDLRGGDVEGVVLESRRGLPLVVRPSGRETSESRFRVLTPEKVVVVSQGLLRDGPSRVLLAPGAYDVEMWHERDGPRSSSSIVIAHDPVVIDMP